MKLQLCNLEAMPDGAARSCGRCASLTANYSVHAPWALACGMVLGGSSGKGVPRQAKARPLRDRRCAPTSLRCSAVWPAAELASLTAFAALRQWRRVSLRSALTRAATRPALLGAPQARLSLSGHPFAVAFVVRHAREEPSRQAVPAGGDLRGDEKRSSGVGARSALRRLARRSCLSVVSEANAASSATRLRSEHRSAVGAQRPPPGHEPSAGTAWRDSKAPLTCGESRAAIKRSDRLFAQQRLTCDRSRLTDRGLRLAGQAMRDTQWSI